MKPNRTERCVTTKPFTGKKPRPLSTTAEHKRQHQQDQGFIKAMNELTAKGIFTSTKQGYYRMTLILEGFDVFSV